LTSIRLDQNALILENSTKHNMLGYDQIEKNLKRIAGQWYFSHRKGPTGVGKTLEDLLGIPENNIPGPNGEMVEIKAIREGEESMITLFTKTPGGKNTIGILLDRFGHTDKTRGKKVLHTTLSGDKYTDVTTEHGVFPLKIDFDYDDYGNITLIQIVDYNHNTYAYWERAELERTFRSKLGGSLILVLALSRRESNRECFCYHKALLLKGFSFDKFIDLIKNGKIKIDLRIGRYPNGRVHDHGTGFRISPNYIEHCFTSKKTIIDINCYETRCI